MKKVAWTGGSFPPANFEEENSVFAALADEYFLEQKEEWEGYWEVPLPCDVEGIFRNRARADAWATLRARGEVR